MGLGVHENDGVRCHLWVVRLYPVLDRRVEIVRWCLFYENRLRQRLRMRGRKLERREEGFWRWRLELEVEGVSWIWWR